jgi:hypothetical protein
MVLTAFQAFNFLLLQFTVTKCFRFSIVSRFLLFYNIPYSGKTSFHLTGTTAFAINHPSQSCVSSIDSHTKVS